MFESRPPWSPPPNDDLVFHAELWYQLTAESHDRLVCGPSGMPSQEWQRTAVTTNAYRCRKVLRNHPRATPAQRSEAIEVAEFMLREEPPDEWVEAAYPGFLEHRVTCDQALVLLFGPPTWQMRALKAEAALQAMGLDTAKQLKQACANVGVDLDCGACASVFYTGAAPGTEHTCRKGQDRPGPTVATRFTVGSCLYEIDPLDVVVGIAQREDGCVLIAQRHPNPIAEWSEKWAFVGGKVDPGESLPEALIREWREEMTGAIEVGELLHTQLYRTPGYERPYRTHTYLVKMTSPAVLTPEGGQRMVWATIEKVRLMDTLPGTIPALEGLAALKKPFDCTCSNAFYPACSACVQAQASLDAQAESAEEH